MTRPTDTSPTEPPRLAFDRAADAVHAARIAGEVAGSGELPPALRRRAMRELARESSHDARRGVYGALLDATLLLAVDRSEGEVRAFPDLEDLGGRPTWLAFSGPEAAGKHERASETVSLSGVRLVRAALHQRIGALRLDFGSPVGGELYANELRSIADSVPAARPPAA